jgi:Tfp pilus assembly PilM family ATPase
MLNPFQRVMPPTNSAAEMIHHNAGQFAVAVGLALRSFDNL